MKKPDYCQYCNGKEFTYIKDNLVFDPDTELTEKVNSWVCTDCNTIHVNNKDFSFIQRDISTDKIIQYSDNAVSNWNK